MKYFALAKKLHETYGQGDNGYEYHICPIDPYHTDSKTFHPLFESESAAQKYKNELDPYDRYSLEIVELETYYE